MDAASSVAASADIPPSEVAESVANLVAKSLLSADIGGTIVHYRLLETTRAYARDKLIESAEFDHFARRHAEYYRELSSGMPMPSSRTQPTAEWLAAYRPPHRRRARCPRLGLFAER
jgi:predicted ATPase